MHITLQIVLQAATLASLIVGFAGLINRVNNYRRQNLACIVEQTKALLGSEQLARSFNGALQVSEEDLQFAPVVHHKGIRSSWVVSENEIPRGVPFRVRYPPLPFAN